MLHKTSSILLAFCFLVAEAKQKPTKEQILKQGRLNVGIKKEDREFDPVEQGDCPEGWVDGSSVGLGCLYADLKDVNINETTAETVCKEFGEGGRLVEILNMEQQEFLQNMLGPIELENQFDGYVWWWIGLNDFEVADQFVWPYNGPANFTWWDQDYDEPYPDPENEINCVEMQSAVFYDLWWWTYWCDDTDGMFAVCQLPGPEQ